MCSKGHFNSSAILSLAVNLKVGLVAVLNLLPNQRFKANVVTPVFSSFMNANFSL